MADQKNSMMSMFHKTLSVLPPVIFILLNIFLFGPFTIYQGNIDEFAFSFPSIIKNFLFPSLIFVSIVGVVGLFVSPKLHKCYVTLLFMIGILIWLQ